MSRASILRSRQSICCGHKAEISSCVISRLRRLAGVAAADLQATTDLHKVELAGKHLESRQSTPELAKACVNTLQQLHVQPLQSLQGNFAVKRSAKVAGLDAGIIAIALWRDQNAWLEFVIIIIYSAGLANDKMDDIEKPLQEAKSRYEQQELPLRELLAAIRPEQPKRLDKPTTSANAMMRETRFRALGLQGSRVSGCWSVGLDTQRSQYPISKEGIYLKL